MLAAVTARQLPLQTDTKWGALSLEIATSEVNSFRDRRVITDWSNNSAVSNLPGAINSVTPRVRDSPVAMVTRKSVSVTVLRGYAHTLFLSLCAASPSVVSYIVTGVYSHYVSPVFTVFSCRFLSTRFLYLIIFFSTKYFHLPVKPSMPRTLVIVTLKFPKLVNWILR